MSCLFSCRPFIQCFPSQCLDVSFPPPFPDDDGLFDGFFSVLSVFVYHVYPPLFLYLFFLIHSHGPCFLHVLLASFYIYDVSHVLFHPKACNSSFSFIFLVLSFSGDSSSFDSFPFVLEMHSLTSWEWMQSFPLFSGSGRSFSFCLPLSFLLSFSFFLSTHHLFSTFCLWMWVTQVFSHPLFLTYISCRYYS